MDQSINHDDLLHLFSQGSGGLVGTGVSAPAASGYQLPYDQTSTAQPDSSQAVSGQLQQADLMHLLTNSNLTNPVQSSGSAAPQDTSTYDPSSIQAYAQPLVAQAFPNDPNAWNAFNAIVNKESGWNPTAANKTSSARGLFQFLNSTAPSYGLPADASTASVPEQVAAGIKYIAARYGTPSSAWDFHTKNNWY